VLFAVVEGTYISISLLAAATRRWQSVEDGRSMLVATMWFAIELCFMAQLWNVAEGKIYLSPY
jgi:hypothetical protein